MKLGGNHSADVRMAALIEDSGLPKLGDIRYVENLLLYLIWLGTEPQAISGQRAASMIRYPRKNLSFREVDPGLPCKTIFSEEMFRSV